MNEFTQQELSYFVNREVIACQTSLVNKLLSESILCYEDIENEYIDHSDRICEIEERIEAINDDIERETISEQAGQSEIDKLEDEKSDLEKEQDEPQEIFEWWLVTDFLAHKLKEHGEPILDTDYGTWWGRTTTGQAIFLDSVISSIYNDLQ